jgi:hypothetical protein
MLTITPPMRFSLLESEHFILQGKRQPYLQFTDKLDRIMLYLQRVGIPLTSLTMPQFVCLHYQARPWIYNAMCIGLCCV